MPTYNKDLTVINQYFIDKDLVDKDLVDKDLVDKDLVDKDLVDKENELKDLDMFEENNIDIYDEIETSDNSNTNTLFTYIESLSNYKTLSAEEEINLAKKVKSGDEEARQFLINSNLKLVYYVAKKYYSTYLSNNHIQLLDLIQDGNIGLIKAVDKYDYTLGYRFSTYAYYWIKHSILRSLSNNSRIIKIPVRTIEQIRLLNKARLIMKTLYNKNDISIEELSSFIQEHPEFKVTSIKKLTPEIIKEYEITYINSQALSLNMPITENEEVVLEDCLEADDSYRADIVIEHKLQENYLCNLLDTILGEKQALIIKLRFGIGCNYQMTLQDISYLCGMSREGIRRLELNSLKNLKNYFITQKRLTGHSYRDLI